MASGRLGAYLSSWGMKILEWLFLGRFDLESNKGPGAQKLWDSRGGGAGGSVFRTNLTLQRTTRQWQPHRAGIFMEMLVFWTESQTKSDSPEDHAPVAGARTLPLPPPLRLKGVGALLAATCSY